MLDSVLDKCTTYEWKLPAHMSAKKKSDGWNLRDFTKEANRSHKPPTKRGLTKGSTSTRSHKPPTKRQRDEEPVSSSRKLQSKITGGISSPSTAQEVYSRLGLQVPTHRLRRFIRSQNSKKHTPIESLDAANRSRMMQSITVALKSVCVPFVGKHWKQLLFYAANNVQLHGERSKYRGTAKQENVLWADQVQLCVLKKSAFVRNIVRRFNNLVSQNDRQSRRERRRILSEICLDLPLKTLQELGLQLPMLPSSTAPRHITRQMYFAAKSHARAFTPGGTGFELPHVKRVNFTIETIIAIVEYVNNDIHVQQMACGAKTVMLSTGETLQIPSVGRKMLREHMWSRYVQDHTDSEGHYIGNFKKKTFMETLETSTDGDQQTYAALDQVKVCIHTHSYTHHAHTHSHTHARTHRRSDVDQKISSLV